MNIDDINLRLETALKEEAAKVGVIWTPLELSGNPSRNAGPCKFGEVCPVEPGPDAGDILEEDFRTWLQTVNLQTTDIERVYAATSTDTGKVIWMARIRQAA